MEHLRSLLYECMLKLNIPEKWAEKPPPLSAFLSETMTLLHMWNTHGPIMEICTQIPPIQISSVGYQFFQLFKKKKQQISPPKKFYLAEHL